MKVLLIPASHTRKSIKVGLPDVATEERGTIPPLGVMYLASSLRTKTNTEVMILDTQFKEFDDYKKIEQEIRRIKPDVVGLQVLTFSLLDALIIARIIKNISPEIKIIFGGRHVSIYPSETVSFPEVDLAIIGEAEETLPKVIQNINNPENLKKIKGIAFKKGNKKTITGLPGIIENLDSLPFPARDLAPYKRYGDLLVKSSAYTTMVSSRGCPYNCSFCDNHLKFRKRSALNVVNEMEHCINQGIKEILIYDSTFTIDKNRVITICKEITKRKLDFTWSTPTRVDCIDEELIKTMKKAGCERLQFGIEAGTQKVLNNLKKGTNIEQIKKAIELTKKEGVTAFADFMMGSPGETKEDILNTINLAKELKLDYAIFQITMPYPDTDLYKEGLKKGILTNDYWKEFAKNPTENFEPAYWEEHLTRKELEELSKIAFKKFYLRPSYIIKRLIKLNSLEALKRQGKAGLKLIGI